MVIGYQPQNPYYVPQRVAYAPQGGFTPQGGFAPQVAPQPPVQFAQPSFAAQPASYPGSGMPSVVINNVFSMPPGAQPVMPQGVQVTQPQVAQPPAAQPQAAAYPGASQPSAGPSSEQMMQQMSQMMTQMLKPIMEALGGLMQKLDILLQGGQANGTNQGDSNGQGNDERNLRVLKKGKKQVVVADKDGKVYNISFGKKSKNNKVVINGELVKMA
ncbi:MAG: hypothetical protein VKJ06_02180 [Vampirovibrionales bacterium]|nr:hypothetical protein [Vampirovibrionales bacterium]